MGFVLLLIFLNDVICADQWISVTCTQDKCSYIQSNDTSFDVSARYKDTLESKGWDKLEIFINTKTSTDDISKALGFAEGMLLHNRILDYHKNMMDAILPSNVSEPVKANIDGFLQENIGFTQAYPFKEDTAHHKHVKMLLSQVNGLVEGYNAAKPTEAQLTLLDFWKIQSISDLLTIFEKYQPCTTNSSEYLSYMLNRNGRGTAIVKLVTNNQELFVGHNTWQTYSSMSRVVKTYNYLVPNGTTRQVAFTGHPGVISSTDGFFTLGNKLVTIDTALLMVDSTLAQPAHPKGLLSWMRVMAANTMASTAEEWVDLVTKEHSGTTSSQYVAVDYTKFTKGREVEDSAVWMVELWPSGLEKMDMTATLRQNSTVSFYNLPKTEEAWKTLKYPEYIAEDTDREFYFHPNKSCRAKLFNKLEKRIHDLDGMKYVTRYNDYEADRESSHPKLGRDSAGSLAARFELRSESLEKLPMGAVDGKITSSLMMSDLNFIAISGPTVSHELPRYTLAELVKIVDFPSAGLPSSYQFDWIQRDWDDSLTVQRITTFMLVTTIVCLLIIALTVLTFTIAMIVRKFMRSKRNQYQPINN